MSLTPEEVHDASIYGLCRTCRAPRKPQTVTTHSIVCPNGHPQDGSQLEDPGPLTSDDIETLLAGLQVRSIAELKRLIDVADRAEIFIEDPLMRQRLHLDEDPAVSSEARRGTAERQPHGCEGQLQQ